MLLSILALSISSNIFASNDEFSLQQPGFGSDKNVASSSSNQSQQDAITNADDVGYKQLTNMLSNIKTAQDALDNKQLIIDGLAEHVFNDDNLKEITDELTKDHKAIEKQGAVLKKIKKSIQEYSDELSEFLQYKKSTQENAREISLLFNTLQNDVDLIQALKPVLSLYRNAIFRLNMLALEKKSYEKDSIQNNIMEAIIEFLLDPLKFESASYGIAKNDPTVTTKAKHLIDFATVAFGLKKNLSPEVAAAVKTTTNTTTKTAAKALAKLPENIKELKAPDMRITRHDIVNLKKSLDAKEIGYYTKVLKEGNAEQKRWAKQILYHDDRIKKKYKK